MQTTLETQVAAEIVPNDVEQRHLAGPRAGGKRRPTVLIPVPYAINVRDVLRTAVFRKLKDAGVRIVIMSPAYQQPDFVREFADEHVHLEPLYPYEPGEMEQKLRTLRFTLFSDLTETIGLHSVPKDGRSWPKRLAMVGAKQAVRVLGRRRSEQLLSQAGLRLFPEHRYDHVFERWRPDLVCLTRVFGTSADHPVLKVASRLRIPSVLLVSSWDNLTSKGVFPARVDRIAVWNRIMAEEAEQLHGIPRDRILVAGAPQFDIYADTSKLPERQAFFRRVGADPGKALVTFALTNARACPDEFDTLEMFWSEVHKGALGRPAQVLARAHPIAGAYGEVFPDRLRGRPDLLVDIPGKPSQFIDRDAGVEDMKHLAATMWHSDVVVNTSSTIAIDAVAVGTPVVCAGFDGRRTLPDSESVRRYHQYTHFKKLLALGGIRVAHDLGQLVGHVRDYLEDPTLDAEGRARIIEHQCHAIDGKAGERLAQFVLKALDELPRPRF